AVAGGVGIRDVAELVRTVAVPEVEHRVGGAIADAGRAVEGTRGLGRVVSELRQQRIEDRRLRERKEIDGGAICRDARGLALVRVGPLAWRTAKRATEVRTDGDAVVGRPGLEHRLVHDRERT